MEFTRRKLPQEEADKMRAVAIHDVKAFVPMPAPVYVFMRQNQKFVSIKSPLDFFVPEELERLNGFEQLYLPEFIDSVSPFIVAAGQVRAILEWQPQPTRMETEMIRSRSGAQTPVPIAPASYEISDAILHVLGPLWRSPKGAPRGSDATLIEPFFTAVFAHELCDSVSPEVLREARDRDVEGYERAVLQSGWAVFLALHLGYSNLEFLKRLYERVFRVHALAESPSDTRNNELEELLSFAAASVEGREFQPVMGTEWAGKSEAVARKLVSRLRRVSEEFIPKGTEIPTIYGARGFVDV